MNCIPERNLTFRLDGTIDPAELEGMPEELVKRVTSPEFIEGARKAIAADIQQKKRAEQLRRDGLVIRQLAAQEHEARRPSGLSGRQRKRLRKALRKPCDRVHLESTQQGG